MTEQEASTYSPSRRRFLILGGIGLGILISAIADEELRRAATYESIPPHFLCWDKAARAAIQTVSRVTSDGMMAHQYDWINQPLSPIAPYVDLEPDPNARPVRSLLDAFLVDAWEWRKTYLIDPKYYEYGMEDEVAKGWQAAFQLDKSTVRLCRVVFSPREKIRVLVGPGPTRYYTRSVGNGAWLPVEAFGPFDRSDARFRQFTLI